MLKKISLLMFASVFVFQINAFSPGDLAGAGVGSSGSYLAGIDLVAGIRTERDNLSVLVAEMAVASEENLAKIAELEGDKRAILKDRNAVVEDFNRLVVRVKALERENRQLKADLERLGVGLE